MIAYYAHEHGYGHANYAQQFAKVFGGQCRILTSSSFLFEENVKVVKLPSENPDGTALDDDSCELPDYLHYSPVGQRSIQERSRMILKECTRNGVDLLIVDVSVEVAALARASSIPYAFVKLPGDRRDRAHAQTFIAALVIFAYYPQIMEPPTTPQWIVDKTIYFGFLSRLKHVGFTNNISEIKNIMILGGFGGSQKMQDAIPTIASVFNQSKIAVYGKFELKNVPENIALMGYKKNISNALDHANLVISSCGLNTISELLTLRKRLAIFPEERPYGEQAATFRFLVDQGYAFDLDMILKNRKIPIDFDLKNPETLLSKNLISTFKDAMNIWTSTEKRKPLHKIFKHYTSLKTLSP